MKNQQKKKEATLGILTLGQSPRNDVVPTIRAILGDSVAVLEAGGLDNLSPGQLDAMRAQKNEKGIETRLLSGEAILVSKQRLLSRLAQAYARLDRDCSRVLLLCSGEFPDLASLCPRLIQPISALRSIVASLGCNSILGIIGPASDMAAAPAQWKPFASEVLCEAASPYEEPAKLENASRRLRAQGAQLLFLDDMGFTEAQRRLAAASSGLPALCVSTLTARYLYEFFASAPESEDSCPKT